MGFMGEVDCRTCKGTGVQPVTVEIETPKIEEPIENPKADVIELVEALVLEVEEEIQSDEIKHKEPTHHETKLERFKRKYTKSAK